MFKMFTAFFVTITTFFNAIGKFMNAFYSLASTAENTAKTFEQEEAINNQVKIRKLKEQAEKLDVDFGDLSSK